MLNLTESDHLLDIACGTGIVARIAKENTVDRIEITGCDINEGMLKVAEEIDPDINWVRGNAKKISDHQYFEIQKEAQSKINKYVEEDGKVRFNMSAHIVTIE